MPVLQLCTYFDVHYLARGLALLESLRRHWPSFQLWALCLDDQTFRILRGLSPPGLRPLSVAELLAADADLATCRQSREGLAFYYTCTPALMLYVLQQQPEAESVFYLDADLYAFGDPAPIFAEFATGSIFVHRHRLLGPWSPVGNGDFNLGLAAHRRNDEGLSCLHRWREQCLNSCDDLPVDGRWGDQQYMEEWPARYPGLVVSRLLGVGVAPWNLGDYRFGVRSRGQVTVNDQDLLCFHFHGLRQVARGLVDTRMEVYGARLGRVARRQVYQPYLAAVKSGATLASAHAGDTVTPLGSALRSDWSRPRIGRPNRPGDIGRLLLRLAHGHLLLA